MASWTTKLFASPDKMLVALLFSLFERAEPLGLLIDSISIFDFFLDFACFYDPEYTEATEASDEED